MDYFKLAVLFCFLMLFVMRLTAIEQAKPDTSKSYTIVDRIYGSATFYADRFQGRRTMSGEKLDQNQYTCATPNLPFHTWVRVTNLKNNKSVMVRANDRFVKRGDHVVDLTRVAAKDIGLLSLGRVQVLLEVLSDEAIFIRIPESPIEPFPDMVAPTLTVPWINE